MKYSPLVLVTFCIGWGLPWWADPSARRSESPQIHLRDVDPGDSILSDVYVRLYLARLQKAKLEVEVEKQELELKAKNRDRLEILLRRNAVAVAEVEEARKSVEIAAMRVQSAKASQDEAETFVDIAISRISLGLDMPICAEMR